MIVGHVGDSRLYRLADGELEPRHPGRLVGRHAARRRGSPTDELAHHPMRHVLTNVVGARDQVDVHISRVPARGRRRVLLCSDGLYEPLGDDGTQADPARTARIRRGAAAQPRAPGARAAARATTSRRSSSAPRTRRDARARAGPARRRRSTLPERIGHFKVIDRIGRGAMGVVYSARDERNGRSVALKVMMADLEGDKETRVRFEREAKVAGELLHRNVINVYDMGEDDGRLYMVMELLQGETLNEYLKRVARLPLERTLDMMMQVCEGLAVAHAHGIVHRDIKPGNLFVQKDGGVKILDFGVARLANSSMTASGFIVGTPDFMSPEQARGQAHRSAVRHLLDRRGLLLHAVGP